MVLMSSVKSLLGGGGDWDANLFTMMMMMWRNVLAELLSLVFPR